MIHIREDGAVTTVILDRPDRRNALDGPMSEQLGRALSTASAIAKPLVLRSSTPGMFVAGTDLTELAGRGRDDALARVNHHLFQQLEDFPWPTIALVDGAALGGGCELALACDFRVASTQSIWGQPEVRLGLVPSAGALWRLPRLIGWAPAVDLILTGRRISGAEAYRLGLAQRLAEPAALDTALDELVRDLGAGSTPAQRLAKEAMRVPADHRRLVDALAQALCYETPEAAQRLAAARRGQ